MFELARGDVFLSEGQESAGKAKNGTAGHGGPLLPPPREPGAAIQKD